MSKVHSAWGNVTSEDGTELVASVLGVALGQLHEVAEGAMEAFVAHHGRWPRWAWVTSEMTTDPVSFTITGHAGDVHPPGVMAWEVGVLNDRAGEA